MGEPPTPVGFFMRRRARLVLPSDAPDRTPYDEAGSTVGAQMRASWLAEVVAKAKAIAAEPDPG
eukprot:14770328-Alexandrium_andersonii.AAC.1